MAGLAAVERKGFLQAMLSRPIALGPIVGLVLGDVPSGLLVGASLELLWLGAVNLGASLPVHEALGTAAITGGTVLAARATAAAGVGGPAVLPAVAVLVVVVCAPLALVGRRADRAIERWNERLYGRAERDLDRGDLDAAVRANLYGLAIPFGVAFVLAPLGAAVAAVLIPMVLARVPPVVLPALALGWAAFGGVACAAGAKAMRTARAPAFYLAALAVGLVSVAAATLAGGHP